MRTAFLDRHVRKEARGLVRDAKRLRSSDAAQIGAVERALAARDRDALRRALVPLDDIVEELARTTARTTTRAAIDGVTWLASLAILVFGIRAFVVQVFQIPSSSMYPTLEIGDHLFVNKFIYGLDLPFTDTKLFQRSPKRGEVIVFSQPCQRERDYIKRVVALAGDTVEVRCNHLYVNSKPVQETVVDATTCTYEDRDDGGEWSTLECSRYREVVGGFTYDTYHERDRPARDALAVGDELDFPAPDLRLHNCSNQLDPDSRPAANQAPGEIKQTASAGACELQAHYIVPAGHVFVMGDNRAHSNDSRFWGSVPLENIRGKAMFIWLSYKHFGWSGMRWPRMGNFVH